MKRSKLAGYEPVGPFVFFLLILLCLYGTVYFFPALDTDPLPAEAQVYVEVTGDVGNPAVYGFEKSPNTANLLQLAGGVSGHGSDGLKIEHLPGMAKTIATGKTVEVVATGKGCRLVEKDMPAFYRITLGLPVYLNRETSEGLNAVPGIGPKLATAIVNYRNSIGGFNRIEEILSVQGIGPNLYEKIKPYLAL